MKNISKIEIELKKSQKIIEAMKFRMDFLAAENESLKLRLSMKDKVINEIRQELDQIKYKVVRVPIAGVAK